MTSLLHHFSVATASCFETLKAGKSKSLLTSKLQTMAEQTFIRKQTKAKRWSFTFDNYEDADMERLQRVEDSYVKFSKRVSPETGTEYLQGYILFPQRKSFLQAKALIGQQAVLTLLKGSLNENDHLIERTGECEDHGNTALKKQVNNAWGPHVGEIQEAKTAFLDDESQALEDFTPTFVKYPKLEAVCKKIKLNRQLIDLKKPENELRPWQNTLHTRFQNPADDRTILWVYDSGGNTGKTWFAKFLVLHEGAIRFENAKSADIKYAFNGERIVLFDFCRSLEGHVNYEVIESIKNGIFLSTKYESQMKVFASPHVCIFANFKPDRTKLSADRWEVLEIKRDTAVQVAPGQPFAHKLVRI